VEGLKDVNVPQRSFFFAADHTETNFAWALHAGVSFDVTEQFVVDLAYRYADLGDARSGVVTAYDGTSSYSGHHIKDITSNDLLLGFRYKLQDAAPVYAVK
jgi:opacity protein-like surface antigen